MSEHEKPAERPRLDEQQEELRRWVQHVHLEALARSNECEKDEKIRDVIFAAGDRILELEREARALRRAAGISEHEKPAELHGWTAYCENCGFGRPFTLHEERDAKDGSLYFEYRCAECASILMTFGPPQSKGDRA